MADDIVARLLNDLTQHAMSLGPTKAGLTAARLSDRVTAALAEAAAEIERLREDAERYKWLRDVGDETWTALTTRASKGPTTIDAAIDAARQEQE